MTGRRSSVSPDLYRVAVIQNQRELVQYSYADVMPLLVTTELQYEWVPITAESIDLIFGHSLRTFDALILCSNALSDDHIHRVFLREAAALREYLLQGKGLLILQQRKPAAIEFLPNDLCIDYIDRGPGGRLDGTITENTNFDEFFMLRYPTVIDLAAVIDRCSRNPDLRGLYWRSFEPRQHGAYDIALYDDTMDPPRSLLGIARPDLQCRVVVSSLFLDWQKHKDLLVNAMRYVVEGRPEICVIRKMNAAAPDFQYALDSLRITRTPYAEYIQAVPALDAVPPIYPTVILDPDWMPDEVAAFDRQVAQSYKRFETPRLVFFETTLTHKRVVKTLGGDRRYERLTRRLPLWLDARYVRASTDDAAVDSSSSAGWDHSFLSTASVLDVLHELGQDDHNLRERYGSSILEYVESHDVDGTYDSVFGASCSLLGVYERLLGTSHVRYERTLEWILSNLADRELPEKILATLELRRVSDGRSQELATNLHGAVLSALAEPQTSLALERFSRFLLEFDFNDDLRTVVASLKSAQTPDGSWGAGLAQTASITRTLMRIGERRSQLVTDLNPTIFRAVLYLQEHVRASLEVADVERGDNEPDVSAVAMAVLALRDFESHIEFNVEEFIASLRGPEEPIGVGRPDAMAIHVRDILATIDRLRRETSTLGHYKAGYDELISERRDARFAQNLSIALLLLSYALVVAVTILLITASGRWPANLSEFLIAWASYLIPAVLVVITVSTGVLLTLLNHFGRTPKWVLSISDAWRHRHESPQPRG